MGDWNAVLYDNKHDFVSEYEAKFRANGDKIYRVVAKINKNSLKPWGETIK